ncbi:hypothetical protein A2b_00048 [Klebsiella phage VLCpiA2b]|jgi:hypothetical protein|nr:hypothetical protein A2b_00048 [Klebsiella phage VLCpiA2b]
MSNKVSLRHIEGNEMAQGHVTRQAMLFAELTRKVAKENSLTQAQVIDEVHAEPSKGIFMGTKVTRTRRRS